jgi:UDP-N-acetylglucosamine 2-epimerase (non-hydrolysing)
LNSTIPSPDLQFANGRKVKAIVVFGTRPEAIKLAPVVKALHARPGAFETEVCVTAQHREMLDQVLDVFALRPDHDLDLMQPDQSLAGFVSLALDALDELFRKVQPDLLIVQGDTSTAFVAALNAFYHRVKVAHVEAGLRSFNRHLPYPEEVNRSLVARLADFHFAPTQQAYENLVGEGVDASGIFVTGNTVVDALLDVSSRLGSGGLRPALGERFPKLPARYILLTAHRRESQGPGLVNIFQAVRDLSRRLPKFHFIFPVHLSPAVQEPARKILGALPQVHLLPPVDYVSFVWLVKNCELILSDSGGVQEEAPSLRKPVLVLREVTERPEAVESGWAQLVGTEKERIVEAVLSELNSTSANGDRRPNPFGDGRAAERIVEALQVSLECGVCPVRTM